MRWSVLWMSGICCHASLRRRTRKPCSHGEQTVQKILYLADPAWWDTLPCRVAPYRAEWLPGLLWLASIEHRQLLMRRAILCHITCCRVHRLPRIETCQCNVALQPVASNTQPLRGRATETVTRGKVGSISRMICWKFHIMLK